MASVAAAGLAAFQVTAPERILARGYDRALGDIDTSWGTPHAGNVWLSSAPAHLSRPALTVGDRITIAARAGGQQSIEVTALEEVDGDALGLAGTRFQIVTGRPTDGAADATVRFLFAVDSPQRTTGSGRSL